MIRARIPKVKKKLAVFICISNRHLFFSKTQGCEPYHTICVRTSIFPFHINCWHRDYHHAVINFLSPLVSRRIESRKIFKLIYKCIVDVFVRVVLIVKIFIYITLYFFKVNCCLRSLIWLLIFYWFVKYIVHWRPSQRINFIFFV